MAEHALTRGTRVGKRLVLWDIDKTLIDVDGLGSEIFSAAFAEFSGLARHRPTHGPGRTEWQWFQDTQLANDLVPTDDCFPRFLSIQDAMFEARAAEFAERGQVLPGAREALERCAANPDIISSLLTGNTRRNAERKLAAFGLDHLVEIPIGGYGDDHRERPELVRVARERVQEATGIAFTADTTVLVGDSPNDVMAALHGGARIVAVATGIVSADELRAAGADTVLDDLSDTDAVLELLLG
ncbi:HAD family hydrolase [Streptomonospora nanhaiensis]|uniref:Phosphoglycolate phosphatase-like HAD superfamily hydrolase n=1 Tax=Streptomonospora nanhaiensis TaxID=1323731 RepID=A0A853BSP8_9ACTN|nr:HAD family hydrolase [Streptomonospora nanhaiensis]MBV2362650.1 HAD family hydrolase [Streptomonospora nanhaiensis]MBX9387286.1 HAD family hydrolase [Streptomonospora nanhaiensis]NYI98000.1 phosphoglycolate phosphatase-like HAD superfamily hydrolase [Streptomonospora nanhaiensis]